MLGFVMKRCVKSLKNSINPLVHKCDVTVRSSYGVSNKYLCTKTADVYEDLDYDKVTKGDPLLLKNLKLIMLEFELLKQESTKVPSKMTNERWSELLALKSKSQRMKQITFWWLKETKKQHDKAKREEKKRQKIANRVEEEDDGHIKYRLGGSSLFLRVYETTMDRWNNAKLIEAMMFGQDIVLDCSYDKHMTTHEASNCAKQLMMLFADNRTHKSPFNLHFVNADPESVLIKKLVKIIPTLYDNDFPINIASHSYLDIFPKDKLVYLTPHCRDELTTFSHDDIYIIGAMVDKVNNQPLSLGKAKAEGLRMAKLPLDRYLDWHLGTKNLTLNQMMNIMLDIKVSNDWELALRHVPKRKLKDEDYQPKVAFLKRKFKGNFDISKIMDRSPKKIVFSQPNN